MDERTPDSNPQERWSDRHHGWKKIPAWFWHHKFYRDIWLVIITVVLLGAVQSNQDRIREVQAERVAECLDQNSRNQNTKAALMAAAEEDIAKAEEDAKRRGQIPELFKNEIEGRRDVTLVLIDMMAPVRNCDALSGDTSG
jgi:hypothetical protein